MRIRYLPILWIAVFGLHAADLPTDEPLFDAIRRADTPAVKRLLDHGSSADSRDAEGFRR